MDELEAVRRLVKSPPELWAQCRDAETLGRHLDAIGGLRITALEEEHTVAWEGDCVSGTVTLEPSGWGTRVRIRAMSAPGRRTGAPETPPAAVRRAGAPEPPPAAVRPSAGGLLARTVRQAAQVLAGLTGRPSGSVPAAGARRPAASTRTCPAVAEPAIDLAACLEAALDSLGRAHHRPYSRA
ncbi:hypothetical protein [Conexibacter sp. DBS9H8]|uniref:hypothetical protein n=1 Tax=Conexibacter sp. DBS9H8 TaxID=2937801 RepID=UPI0020102A40|nr:hypothetical protein [Conexibacter sp. DBS9H8]